MDQGSFWEWKTETAISSGWQNNINEITLRLQTEVRHYELQCLTPHCWMKLRLTATTKLKHTGTGNGLKLEMWKYQGTVVSWSHFSRRRTVCYLTDSTSLCYCGFQQVQCTQVFPTEATGLSMSGNNYKHYVHFSMWFLLIHTLTFHVSEPQRHQIFFLPLYHQKEDS